MEIMATTAMIMSEAAAAVMVATAATAVAAAAYARQGGSLILPYGGSRVVRVC